MDIFSLTFILILISLIISEILPFIDFAGKGITHTFWYYCCNSTSSSTSNNTNNTTTYTNNSHILTASTLEQNQREKRYLEKRLSHICDNTNNTNTTDIIINHQQPLFLNVDKKIHSRYVYRTSNNESKKQEVMFEEEKDIELEHKD